MKYKKYKKNLQKFIEEIEIFDANKADVNTKYLKKMFNLAYKYKVFHIHKLSAPKQAKAKKKLFMTLPKYSGALSFLGIQIVATYSILQNRAYHNKQHYFCKKPGIAINHLRAPHTIIKGEKVQGGYKLYGQLRWVSGFTIFDSLLIGFHTQDQELEAMCDFKASKSFQIRSQTDTFVGNSMNTVDVRLDGFFIPQKSIVGRAGIGSYSKAKSLSKTVHFALFSLVLGAIEQIQDKNMQKKSLQVLYALSDKFQNSTDIDELDTLRVKLALLGLQVIVQAMVLEGGAAVLSTKTLQRYYKELLMFNANGLNNRLKEIFQEHFYLYIDQQNNYK